MKIKIIPKISLAFGIFLITGFTNELRVFSSEKFSEEEKVNKESDVLNIQNNDSENYNVLKSNRASTTIPNGTTIMRFNDSTGELIIEPANGVSGEMDSSISSAMLYTYNQIKTIIINPGVSAPQDSYYLFADLPNLIAIDVTNLNVSNVQIMARMFSFDSSLTTITGLEGWNTSSVTEMWSMFDSDSSIETLNIGTWNTSSVTDMRGMFQSASMLKELNISNWTTTSVKDMGVMFEGTQSLLQLDLRAWDTSNVTMMKYMFAGMTSLEDLLINSWDTSKVTNMGYMFSGNTSLTYLNLSNWNTHNVTDMNGMLNNDRLTSLTLGQNFQVPEGADTGLLPLSETDMYTGKWQNIGQGSVDNPKGVIILDSLSLMNAYGRDKTCPSKEVETYVWQKKLMPVITSITYSDGVNKLIPEVPIPKITGNIGDSYVIIDAPIIKGYHIKEIFYNDSLISVGDKIQLMGDGRIDYIYERDEIISPLPLPEEIDSPDENVEEISNGQEQTEKSEIFVDNNVQTKELLPKTGESTGLWSTLFGLLIIMLVTIFSKKILHKRDIK